MDLRGDEPNSSCVQPAPMPWRMPYPYLYPLGLDFAMNSKRSLCEQPSAPLRLLHSRPCLCLARFTPTRVEGYQLSAKTQCGHLGTAATHLHKRKETWLGSFELYAYRFSRAQLCAVPSYNLQGPSAIVHLGRTAPLRPG